MARDDDELQRIAHDLELCDLALAVTKGASRRKFLAQRKACFARIAQINREAGDSDITDDELLAELLA